MKKKKKKKKKRKKTLIVKRTQVVDVDAAWVSRLKSSVELADG